MLALLFNSVIVIVPFVAIMAYLLYARGNHVRPPVPTSEVMLRQQLSGIHCPTCGRPLWTGK